MQHNQFLQSPPPLRHLRDEGPVSLFLDFDGTLVELAPTPDSIAVPAGLAAALAALSQEIGGRLGLVSGRALEDIEVYLGALSIARAGSHGSDCRMADGTSLGAAPQELSPSIRASLGKSAEEAGLSLEEKPHGAALHYRHDPSLEAVANTLAERFAEQYGLDLKLGKCVVELVAGGANKGSAVEAFMQAAPFAGSRPIFIGDDVTDEDGFLAAQKMGGFGVLVGDRKGSAAQYQLADTQSVYQWLGL